MAALNSGRNESTQTHTHGVKIENERERDRELGLKSLKGYNNYDNNMTWRSFQDLYIFLFLDACALRGEVHHLTSAH